MTNRRGFLYSVFASALGGAMSTRAAPAPTPRGLPPFPDDNDPQYWNDWLRTTTGSGEGDRRHAHPGSNRDALGLFRKHAQLDQRLLPGIAVAGQAGKAGKRGRERHRADTECHLRLKFRGERAKPEIRGRSYSYRPRTSGSHLRVAGTGQKRQDCAEAGANSYSRK